MGAPTVDPALLENALDACNRLTRLRFRIKKNLAHALPNARIVEVTTKTGPPILLAAIERPTFQMQEIGALADLAGRLPHPLLLAAPYVNPQAAGHARELGVAFVDLAGNAYLRGPGLFVFITGRRAPGMAKQTRAARALTPAGLRVVFGVLLQPELLDAPYRDVAAATGVALGTVAAVMEDLVRRGYVTGEGVPDKRLLAPQRLAEEWTLMYPVRLRPKLLAGRFTALEPGWWERARVDPQRAVWGGEVAADLLTKRLKPERQTLYVWGTPDEIILANRLRPDDKGDVELLKAFWKHAQGRGEVPADVAPPLLIYADLLATGDPRNVEMAQLLRERYLRGVLGPA